MKNKQFDWESKIEKLEDILEERLESIENRLEEDLKINIHAQRTWFCINPL